MRNYDDKFVEELIQERIQLKQQLAEKDKLIEFYINSGKEQCEEINKLNHRALNYCDEIDKNNQEKISFAVEQIVKTKETLIKFLQDENFYESEWYDLFEKIDNQIKQLKEGK